MLKDVSMDHLISLGLDHTKATLLFEKIQEVLKSYTDHEPIWNTLSRFLSTEAYPFSIHLELFTSIYPMWRDHPENAPAWIPTDEIIKTSNLTKVMETLAIKDINEFHEFSVKHYQDFLLTMVNVLNIQFKEKFKDIVDLSQGIETPIWFKDAKMNIADSCFTAPSHYTAIIYQDHQGKRNRLSYGELNQLSNKIANSLYALGYKASDAIAIIMPMTPLAIAIYLGIIKIGGVVVSIADSFSAQEMLTRLKIANTKLVFTQDIMRWGGKKLPLYEKIKDLITPSIVLPCDKTLSLKLESKDKSFIDFLLDHSNFTSIACDPMMSCNILFSSGTTGTPKAIPWNHTTPIKVASDAYFHHNIKPQDVLAWPTNLGWMMGPWLLFASFINQGSIALFNEAPKTRAFGEFISFAHVTMLGVVPTLVASFKQSGAMEGLDWSSIKSFSSSGECSNPEDMLYLMSLADYKPIIEYCGGTEIGGGYVSSTMIQKNYLSLFTTKAIGSDFMILDEHNKPATYGEVAIIPPSIGLSVTLLNDNHHQVYFDDMPIINHVPLRRHGDQMKYFSNGCYAMLGRVDDTMNLGGIKVSAAEIERVLVGLPGLSEVAAVAQQ